MFKKREEKCQHHGLPADGVMMADVMHKHVLICVCFPVRTVCGCVTNRSTSLFLSYARLFDIQHNISH